MYGGALCCGQRRVGAWWCIVYIVLWTEEGRCMVVNCVHCVVDQGG